MTRDELELLTSLKFDLPLAAPSEVWDALFDAGLIELHTEGNVKTHRLTRLGWAKLDQA